MKLNKPILLILILSLSVSLFTIYQRADAEKPYNKVELVADYSKYKKLGHDMGMDMDNILKHLRDAGVTTVAIKEESLEDIKKSGRISVMNLWELSEKSTITDSLAPVIKELMDSNLDPSGTVVVIPNSAGDYGWIKESLKNRAAGFKDWSRDGAYVLTFSGRYEDLEDFTLGFDFSKFDQAKDLGLNISARPSNYMGMTPEYIRSLFEKFQEYNVTSVIFNGVQVLGYPYNLEVTADMVKKTGIVIGPIEAWTQLMHIEQKGMNSLIQLADYKAVRVFSLNEAEANKVSFKEVMDRWFRAVDERNLRLVYLNPKEDQFMSPAENFETNLFYIKEFVEIIRNRGFVIDRVVPMKDFNIGRTRLLVLLAGVVAGGLLLLDNMLRIRKSYLYGLFAAGMVSGLAMLYVMPSLADKAFALGAAIVFPSLSMIYILQLCRRIIEQQTGETGLARLIGTSTIELLKASGISLIGAAFVASMLSSTAYLLELDVFRGVKIAHIIPLAVFVVAYFIVIGYRRDEFGSIWEEIKSLLDTSITVKYILLLGIIAVGGYLYLGRTGHTAGAPIFELEVRIRTLLEQALVARPRTKEFLVAHPAMILMIAGVLKKYKSIILPLGLAGAIGQVSMVNSFSHLRTPLYMSAYRTVYGLAIGIVLSIIGIIFLWMVVHIYNARRRIKDV